VKLNPHDILIKNANVWDLLGSHRISLVYVFNELNSTEYVL